MLRKPQTDLAAKQEPYQKAYLLKADTEEFSRRGRENGPIDRENEKEKKKKKGKGKKNKTEGRTKRPVGGGRRTRQ